MRGTTIRRALGLTACALFWGKPVRADHFSSRRQTVSGQERATVLSHGMDLFEITSGAGGYTPAQRARVVVERLEELGAAHDFDDVRLSVGFRNGEVILQQQDEPGHPAHLILTIDRSLARRAGSDPERLACWYLALLWDHLRLANGRRPLSTEGTPVGDTFQKVFARIGASGGHVEGEIIERALAALPASEDDAFCKAACAVPVSFRPDRPRKDAPSRPDAPAPPPEDPPARRNGLPTPAVGSGSENRPFTKVSGRYRVTLRPEPTALRAGRETEFEAEIADAFDAGRRIADAAVRVRLLRAEDRPAPAVTARFDPEARAYRFRLAFDRAAPYRIAVGVLTAGGDAFTLDFEFAVGPPSNEGGPTPAFPDGGTALDRVRRDGTCTVRLALTPARAEAGQRTEFAVKITEDAPPGEVAAAGATVRAWLAPEGEDYSEVPRRLALPVGETGVYRWRITLPEAGRYRLVVRITTTTDKKFSAEFPVSIAEADGGAEHVAPPTPPAPEGGTSTAAIAMPVLR